MPAFRKMPVIPVRAGSLSKKVIPPGELSRRVAIIRRFKELLKAQRDRFSAYLDSLEKQRDVILGGTSDDLVRHVELEEKIVSDIFSIQKVIDPLEEMYQSIKTEDSSSTGVKTDKSESGEGAGGEEVISLKEALEGLKAEAVIRSSQNRELLAKRMAELRSDIKNLRSNSYARRQSVFGNTAATQIDIKG